jgi:hypothetical protein
MSGPYTSYALYAERTVGDQPGRPQPRYLTSWQSLPEGVFIATNKYVNLGNAWATPRPLGRPFEYVTVPFPSINGLNHAVPHVSFDPQGRLVDDMKTLILDQEIIPLARGSILYSPGADNTLELNVREAPPGNSVANYHRVVVEGLTGRARVETLQIP